LAVLVSEARLAPVGLRQPAEVVVERAVLHHHDDERVDRHVARPRQVDAVAKYDEQVARALQGAHNAARVARSSPDYVRVGAGLGSAFVWALLDLADAIRTVGGPGAGGAERLPERRP